MFVLIIRLALFGYQTTACPILRSKYSETGLSEVCSDPFASKCSAYVGEILTDISGCAPVFLQASLQAGSSDFLSGFITGLQQDENTPSACIQSAGPLQTAAGELAASALNTIDTLSFIRAYDVVYAFNEFMNDLVSLYELCTLQSLIKKVAEVRTRDGFAFIVLRLGTHFDTIVDGFDDGINALMLEKYYTAGVQLGVAIQFLFDFYL